MEKIVPPFPGFHSPGKVFLFSGPLEDENMAGRQKDVKITEKAAEKIPAGKGKRGEGESRASPCRESHKFNPAKTSRRNLNLQTWDKNIKAKKGKSGGKSHFIRELPRISDDHIPIDSHFPPGSFMPQPNEKTEDRGEEGKGRKEKYKKRKAGALNTTPEIPFHCPRIRQNMANYGDTPYK